MAKKKKAKTPDFKKAKVKAGKPLPAHLNETRPEFKAKKILIKALQEKSDVDPLKLLASNNPLKSNLKQLYLSKLNQNLLSNKDFSNGGERVRVICKYLTDYEAKVREEAIKCLRTCINLISSLSSSNNQSLSPLFSIILTHLNCAINHINENIRDDAQKFLSFVIERCDPSLENSIKAMFLSKINSSSSSTSNAVLNSIELDYYSLLEKFIVKIKGKNKENKAKMPNEPSSCGENVPVLNWTPTNSFIDLRQNCNLNTRFSKRQDLCLTFPTKASAKTKDTFIEAVKQMVIKDIKLLVNQKMSEVNLVDARKLVHSFKICLELGAQNVIIDFWKHTFHQSTVPSVTIVEWNRMKKGKDQSRSAQSKLIAHTQNQLGYGLNRFRKIVAIK